MYGDFWSQWKHNFKIKIAMATFYFQHLVTLVPIHKIYSWQKYYFIFEQMSWRTSVDPSPSRCQRSSAEMSLGKSARMFLASSATRSRSSCAVTFPNKSQSRSVSKSPASSAATFLKRSARTCPSSSASRCLRGSPRDLARTFPGRSALRSPRRSARLWRNQTAIRWRRTNASRSARQAIGARFASNCQRRSEQIKL